MESEQVESAAHLTAHSIGGIDRTEVTFEPGVSVLVGRNATNRTSLLESLKAVLGSDDVSIKADAEEARAELRLDGERYTRTLHRQNGSVSLDGEPYLERSTLADLFAFLLESNEARRAVVTEANLRDIILRPVDTDAIQNEIDDLLEERRQISSELDELDDLKGQLPALEEQRTEFQSRIEETRTELQAVEAEIESRDIETADGAEEKVEAKLQELRETRSELEDVRYKLETERNSLESLRAEKRDVEEEYDALPETSASRLERLESRIEQHRSRKQTLETELNELQSVISFNQDRLGEDTGVVAELFEDDTDSGAVTDELMPDETVTCWTCGSAVDAEQIDATIEKLRGLSQETVSEINDLEDELDEMTDQRRELEDQRRRRTRLEQRRQEFEDELDETEQQIEDLSDRRNALREEVETIEADVQALESEAYEELLELHKEANELDHDLGRLETDLERVEGNIATIEDRLDDESRLKARREDVNDDIEKLRTRIERIERRAIEKFNDHMDTVLDLLAYENLERIWIERKQTETRDGRRTVTQSVFDLHVVRQTDAGTTYEDTVHNLSESEREVTGLIFCLSGYLAHDVHETVPFMLLDSLEAIDSDRIARLIDYVENYSEYLVVALLPEDAAALECEHQRISEI